MKPEDILPLLVDIVGVQNASKNEAVLAAYAYEATLLPPGMPDYIVRPASADEVSKILQLANKHKIPVVPLGTGASVRGLVTPYHGGIVLDLNRMDQILEINTDAAYAVVEPGVTIGRLAVDIRKVGYVAAIGNYPAWNTVMSNFLMRPNTHYRTSILDDILGLEVVLPDGTTVTTGSAAFPNGAWNLRYGPFPDLAGLFLCSWGTLGVVTKAAVRIYPRNEAHSVVLFAFDNLKSAIEFSKRTSRAGLVEHIVFRHWTQILFADVDPFGPWSKEEIDPQTPLEGLPYILVLIQISGYKEELEHRRETLEHIAKELGGKAFDEELKRKFPEVYEHYYQLHVEHMPTKKLKFWSRGQGASVITMTPPNEAVDLEQKVFQRFSDHHLYNVPYYGHIYDQARTVFIRFTPHIDPSKKKEVEEARKAVADITTWAMANYKSVPYRARGKGFSIPMLSQLGGYYDLLKRIKQTIDPNNIMNPGILF